MIRDLGQYSQKEFHDRLVALRRWGRWGTDDQRGAANLLTAERVVSAARLVQTGQLISLARDFPTEASGNNPKPAEHFMRVSGHGQGQGSASDYIGVNFHGRATTHLDALGHNWDQDGMFNGKDPEEAVTYNGVVWGGIENFATGLLGRGVLLDVAARRPQGYVDYENPVTCDELAEVAKESGIELEPGDIIVVHSGRDAWERAYQRPWGSPDNAGDMSRPGLDSSCLEFFHGADSGVVVWDMMDMLPNTLGLRQTVHAIIYSQGIPLVDNALIEPLAEMCQSTGRSEFMMCIVPLRIVGGTGSPVNPIAIF